MADFFKIRELRKKYGYFGRFESKNNFSNHEINSIINFFEDKGRLFEAFQKGLNPELIPYLEEQKEAHVVNLFIDISSFSTKILGFSNEKLSNYLDKYYDLVIPIIYKHGGEIDKIIGDGIIAVFGPPFLTKDLDELLKRADRCSKEIIITLENTTWESKVALHDGEIKYYKNKSVNYPEYTMIGQPITDLFRLESVALGNSVNFYHNGFYDKVYRNTKEFTYTINKVTTWTKGNKIPINLKGVSYEFINSFSKEKENEKHIDTFPISRSTSRIKALFESPNQLKEFDNFVSNTQLLENSFCVFYSTVLSFAFEHSLNNSKEEDFLLYNTYVRIGLDEVYALINSMNNCRKVEISQNEILAYFNTPYRKDIIDCFILAMKINGLIHLINKKIKLGNLKDFRFKIGLDYGKIFSHTIGLENDSLIFTGAPIINAQGLSKIKNIDEGNWAPIRVSKVIHNNLLQEEPKYKEYFKWNSYLNCWQSFYYRTEFEQFLDN